MDLVRINFLVIGGAPSIVGRFQCLAARMVVVVPQMGSLHCVIHQSLLCIKHTSELKKTMDSVMTIINFVALPVNGTAFSATLLTCQLNTKICSFTMTLDGSAKEMH